MVRLADLPEAERKGHLDRIATLPKLEGRPFVRGGPLSKRRIAIVTTAGLQVRGDRPFDTAGGANDYRVIPVDTPDSDVVMSHVSVNYDRSGFQSDWNVTFPLDRLKELARDAVIGSVAAFHYSFMGATNPITKFEGKARELAGLLKRDKVEGVVLTPV